MSFVMRSASSTWEPVPLPTNPPVMVWAWFKPEAAPNSVVFQLPPELFAALKDSPPLTMRTFLLAIGMEALIGWTLYGQQIELDSDTMRWLDAALPQPPENGDRQLIFWSPMNPGRQKAIEPAIEKSVPEVHEKSPEELKTKFESLEFFWTNILYLESDIRRARAQLEQSVNKLNSLNRELNFEETNVADSVDRQQWHDVRRWLREASFSVTRTGKEIDVALLSSVAQRNQFLEIYENFVKPRIPFPKMDQAVADFEAHHKALKIVLQSAQTAIHKGTADGERRANTILNRLDQKIRQKNQPIRGKKL